MMNGVELLVDCTETGSLGAPLLSNTELIKWRKVYVRNGERSSIPIVRNNIIVKGLSIPIFRNNRFGERRIDTYR